VSRVTCSYICTYINAAAVISYTETYGTIFIVCFFKSKPKLYYWKNPGWAPTTG